MKIHQFAQSSNARAIDSLAKKYKLKLYFTIVKKFSTTYLQICFNLSHRNIQIKTAEYKNCQQKRPLKQHSWKNLLILISCWVFFSLNANSSKKIYAFKTSEEILQRKTKTSTLIASIFFYPKNKSRAFSLFISKGKMHYWNAF